MSVQHVERIQEQIEIKREENVAPQVDFLSTIPAEQKVYDTGRSKNAIKAENARFLEKQAQEGYKYSEDEMMDNANKLKNASELLLRDKKWYRLFDHESTEMRTVKESVAYLNNILDGDVPLTNGMIDPEYIRNTVLRAYQEASEACEKYLQAKDEQGGHKHATGIRRYNKVKSLMNMIRQEYDNFEIALDNIYANQIQPGANMSVRTILSRIRTKQASVSRFMPEGNSSNVYRIKVIGEDGKAYYVKKDEKLLHENFELYTTNRIAELTRSKQIREDSTKGKTNEQYLKDAQKLEEDIRTIDEKVKAGKLTEEAGDKMIIEIRAQREELRLEGKIDLDDYTDAIDLLTTMNQKACGEVTDAKKETRNRYIKLFAHDFDKFFTQLTVYNATVEKYAADKDQIDDLIKALKAKNQKDPQIAVLEQAKVLGFETMNEWQWFESHLQDFGITVEKDQDVLDILKRAGSRKNGLSRLFTRSLGKEAELFGQHAERSGLSASDVLAANNTATSRVAGVFGFDDVVTTSFKGKLEFTEVGKTEKTVANVTFSEEAPGEELLQIMEDAQKLQKEQNIPKSIVKFSKKALQQMSRMHTFDLITLQTDRHWRNIKAQVTKKEGNPPEWIIDTVKCYDHDQSFGPKDLKEYFEDEFDPTTKEWHTKRQGFLSPIMMTVSKNSNLYRYVKVTRLANLKDGKSAYDTGDFLKDITYPSYNTKELEDAEKNLNKNKEKKTDIFGRVPFYTVDKCYKYLGRSGLPNNEENFFKGMMEKNPGKEELVRRFYNLFNGLIDMMVTSDDAYIHLTMKKLQKDGVDDDEIPGMRDKYVYEQSEKWESDHRYDEIYQGEEGQERFDEDYKRARERFESEAIGKFSSKKEVLRNIQEIVRIYRQLDLTGLEKTLKTDSLYEDLWVGGKNVPGYLDYAVQGFLYQVKTMFEADAKTPDLIKEIQEEDEREHMDNLKKDLEKQGLPADEVNKRLDEEREIMKGEKVRLPAVLHMDKKAFDSVMEAYNNPAKLELILKDLNMTSDKKKALRNRLGQIIDEAKEAEKMVKEWADQQGLPEDDIRRKFFLKDEDYDKIDSLTDMVLDPGQSYFSAEDSQFLAGEQKMKQFMSKTDRERARKLTNDERNTQRQKMGDIEGDYTPFVNNKVA